MEDDIMKNDISKGDMKKDNQYIFSESMFLILVTLIGPLHGYGIMQEIERISGGLAFHQAGGELVLF